MANHLDETNTKFEAWVNEVRAELAKQTSRQTKGGKRNKASETRTRVIMRKFYSDIYVPYKQGTLGNEEE